MVSFWNAAVQYLLDNIFEKVDFPAAISPVISSSFFIDNHSRSFQPVILRRGKALPKHLKLLSHYDIKKAYAPRRTIHTQNAISASSSG